MKVLGLISGTSHDGIDAAVVDFSLNGMADGELRGEVEYTASTPYDDDLRTRLRHALPPSPTSFAEVCELDTLIGQAFAEAAATAVDAVDVDLICSHGQTVFHWVDGQQALGTLQIGQPAWIAERTGRPVVHDVRSRDVAAGGQGAPLVSVLDVLVLGGVPGHPAALNLGGIANMTVLRPGPDSDGPIAYDIGPANALIDAAVLRTGGHPAGFDVDGRIAARGQVVDGLLARLLDEPYYRLPAPKSTGKELFHDRYLAEALTRFGSPVADDDLVATLTALTARTVADQVTRFGVDRLVVSGGGAANPTMLAMLRSEASGVEVVTSDTVGAPISEKEAIAFALIGWLTAHGLPATVPSCTGAADARILGSIVPGAGPLVLPPPLAAPPRTLILAGTPEVTG